MSEKNNISRKIIVIGASAGGLTPLTQLIRNLKIDNNTSVIVAMHMSPQHNSFLADILAKSTKFPVKNIQNKEAINTKTIYVVPPNRHLLFENLHFKLISDESSPQPNINLILESVAQIDEVIAIGVILSGNGDDGTKGLLTLKTQGGLTMVQDPNSAEYDSMPQAAVDADAADFILQAAEIGSSISLIIKQNQFGNFDNKTQSELSYRGISAILEYLNSERQIDLHNYKSNTLRRRIHRRVALGGFTDISAYLTHLKANPVELEALINDIFISVTQFMRDPIVWEKLRLQVIAHLNKSPGKLLRIWCVGCSSGEEAYSWAILLEEIKSQVQKDFDFIIFATDISEKSINQARRGVYDISLIEQLNADLLGKYFVQNQYGYQVIRFIRDKIVFSTHNLLLDPPFSNMDFLSCRNVLIYFNPKLQKRALANFAYSLHKDGLLILGTSESVGQKCSYFSDFDKEHKFFKRTDTVSSQHFLQQSLKKPANFSQKVNFKHKQEHLLLQVIQEKVAEYSGYSAFLIDEKDDIQYTYGEASQLINKKTGRFSQSIFNFIDNSYCAALRALILKSRRTQNIVKHVEKLEQNGIVVYAVLPVKEPENWLVIILSQISQSDLAKKPNVNFDNLSSSKLVHELEAELNTTRMSLQTVVEELEQTNDALQSSNEELQSSNEELQATNEELQTTNEELQSSNEELRTLNEALRIKNVELDLVSSHLQSVEENLETPYILLSKELKVVRFSKTIALFSPSNNLKIDDQLANVPWLKPDATLIKNLKETISLVIKDRAERVLSGFKINQCRYDISIKHYTDKMNQFSEIMLVFNDVTQRFNLTEQVLGDFKKRENILNLLETAIIYTDAKGLVKYVNPQVLRYIGVDKEQAIGEHIDRLLFVFLDVNSKFPEAGLFQKMTDEAFGFNEFAHQTLVIKQALQNYTIRINVSRSDDETEEAAENNTRWLFEIHDISNETELNLRLEYNSCHDVLTGLQNTRALEDRISQISQGFEAVDNIVYALIDIDNFKPINDIAGHIQGDQALQHIAMQISNYVRNEDSLARIGGDEFALLLVNVPHAQAQQILKNINRAIAKLEVETPEGLFNISASVSWIYIENATAVNLSDLYSFADECLYNVKKSGGNNIKEFYLKENYDSQSLSVMIFEKVKYAFKHQLFTFAFQPIINLKDKNHRYFELLIRLKDNNQLIPPAEFMPVIERYNYTRQFDQHVFRHALEMIDDIHKRTSEQLHFAINLSASAIEYPDVFEIIADFPQLIGSQNIQITLEITETAAIKDLLLAKRFIERAHNLGFKVALDDFGVGYNGYHYLKVLEVDTVKIDGAFVQGMLDSEVDRVFIRSVIELSMALNFDTVAECVDSEKILDLITQYGVKFSQGYLHAKPLMLDDFYAYLEK